ncbi:NTP transferase domain-containing protein [Priestia filamentosa]|uniref:nucleotidyltransferase family protein n=1 Tax=Priestia filamentosa TaxID=1402861 RepID=UPI001FB4C3D8|nr:nucleotidyltransferase family protein [Priestia filamentosa]MED3729096.1 nucleotidyltransferase family protein [Priestia filamentosa]UOE58867.1 NTP transferase domain-containing protein [Priestia filamentosa]
MKIAGIFLAAGSSKRMGVDKLSLPFQTSTIGNTSLSHALLSQLHTIIVVHRPNDDLFWMNKSDKRVHFVSCIRAEKGQAYSLKSGVQEAIYQQANAVVVLLADQPFVTSTMVNDLMFTYSKQPFLSFIAPRFQGTMAPPILFAASMFPLLLSLEGDIGARKILKHRSDGLFLSYKEKKWLYDIDTKEAYEHVFEERRK